MKKKKIVRESIAMAEPKTSPGTKPAPTTTPGTRPAPGRPSPIRRDRPSVEPRPKASAEELAQKVIALSKKDKGLRDLLKKKYK